MEAVKSNQIITLLLENYLHLKNKNLRGQTTTQEVKSSSKVKQKMK